MIHATLMLCDFAQVAEGKLYIAGGGWTFTNRLHGYIAGLLRLPWEYSQKPIHGAVSLVDEHGAPVLADGESIRMGFDLVAAPGVNAVPGAPLDGPFALPLPTYDLPKGAYKLVFEVEGEVKPDWELGFRITEPMRPGAKAADAPSS